VVAALVSRVFREDSGRILATMIRLVGDIDLAEEMVQEAFAVALERWPRDGAPRNPLAWMVQTARNRAIDRLRREARFEGKRAELAALDSLARDAEIASRDEGEGAAAEPRPPSAAAALDDDRLRLIFTCCHPSLAVEAQIALTLRTLCGLSTDDIARAFLVPAATMAQRLVRTKQKIREAGIPYQVPAADELPERIHAVATVVYLVFNEGYAATAGDALVRRELCADAIRLGRLLTELLPDRVELGGLLALMLLHDARRDARVGADGEMVLLEEQDRGRWDQAQIREGLDLVERALRAGPPAAFTVQAAIAALHARAGRAADTDWPQIAALYGVLSRIAPSPIVELNRAVAVAMAEGAERGLDLMAPLAAELGEYHLLHAARADLLRRLGRREAAAQSYQRALALTRNEPERRFLLRRLREVG
jgi:RNA polymerase sigma-70 factor, ECF subfamily